MSAGTQLAASTSTVVLFTVLKVLEQSVIASQWPFHAAFVASVSHAPFLWVRQPLTSKLTSERGRHCCMAPAVTSLLVCHAHANRRTLFAYLGEAQL